MWRWVMVFEVALSGCSLTLSGPSANRPRNQPPACDAGKGMVVADALIATTLALVGVGEASSSASSAILPIALGAVFVGAALHGNSITNKCRHELDAYNVEIAGASPSSFVPLDRPLATLPRPVPDVAVRPPRKPPVAATPTATPTPTAPPTSTPVEVTPAAPRPATVPAPTPPRVAPEPPRPTPATAEGPWQEFWREVP